jgi:hypothetical protein
MGMPMNIHQIQMLYDKQQDRILLRVSTRDQAEFRFWLTRRFVKRLWELLLKLLEQDGAFRSSSLEARRALLGMQHETFIGAGDFSQAYEDGTRQLPLGPEPVLLTTARGKAGAGGARVLSLHPARGQGIDIALNSKLLHMIVKLLRDAVARSDWDIRITLMSDGDPLMAASSTASRTLN